MKKTSLFTRLLALLLVAAMLFGTVGCTQQSTEKPQNSNLEADQVNQLDRDSLEQITDILDDDRDTDDLSDQELADLVEQLLGTENQDIVNLGNSTQEALPTVDTDSVPGAYDDNGAMTKPFDQVYPELIEQEKVSFSGESILVKLEHDTLTDGLKVAGIGALELIVPMDSCGWYEAKLVEGSDAKTALAAVRELDEVMLAEYNYEIRTAELDHYKDFGDRHDFNDNGHHKDQWHQHHCGIPNGFEEMETEGGSSSVIVAVIDTGVDYNHEDLMDNMWYNTAEIPDNGIDDDGNGYIDDYYGIDLVAGKGSADDDNGHGTHVAGIIAARDNNVGVVGIAYSVKVMPIKAAMHNGTLNQANIAKAILYAYEMGAEVINMSFGGGACSIAVQDALAVAYSRCVLVASAGNSGSPNENSDKMLALPNYPAALSYVLGVMSVDENGVESSFSNWDTSAFNGVEYELYAPGENIMSTLPGNRYGYLSGTSMAAPIVSSMAAILRSEFSDRDMYPTKFIYGQLASTSEYYAECIDPKAHEVNGEAHNLPQIVNLEAALTKLPKPEVGMQDYAIFDSVELSDKNNGDGVIDAGETIALGLTLRNRWGMSENTLVTIDTLENGIADPYIQIVNPTVDYGSVGTYSTGDCGKIYTDELLTGWENPFIIKIADDCPNDYRITFHVTVTCHNALDKEDTATYTSGGRIDMAVRSGKVLPSVIDEDMVLTADNLYIIPNSTVIQAGVTVKVMPGTHIQFWSNDPEDPYADSYIAYLLVNGRFLVEGTKENPVYIYPSQLMDHYNVEIGASSTGYISLKYADITNLACCSSGNSGTRNYINSATHCTFRLNYHAPMACRGISGGSVYSSTHCDMWFAKFGKVSDSVFYKLALRDGNYRSGSLTINGTVERCIFVDCGMEYHSGDTYGNYTLKDCVLLGNSTVDQTLPGAVMISKLTAQTSSLLDMLDYITVAYRPETGTTYVCYRGSSGNTYYSVRAIDTLNVLLEAYYGGGYAILENKDEADWICEAGLLASGMMMTNYNCGFNMGLSHDQNGELVWSDGTPVGSFITRVGKNTNVNPYYCKTEPGGGDDNALFEIPGQILPEEITFHNYEIAIDLDSAYQLSPLNTPIQLPASCFLYESSDETVVTVSGTGLITPVGLGTANVWVYSLDQAVRNHVTVEVKDYVALEGIAFGEASGEVAIGELLSTTCLLTPVDTTRRNAAYTSSDEQVATVDEMGIVTGISSGTAIITAECEGITAEMTVTVYQKANSIKIDVPSVASCITDTTAALPTVTPSEGGEVSLQWSVLDPKVAAVDGGVIQLLNPGITTLTATDIRSGQTDSTILYVSAEGTPGIRSKVGNYCLMDNGDVYYLGSGTPQLLTQNVKSLRTYSDCATLVYEDNSIAFHTGGSSGVYHAQFPDLANWEIADAIGYRQSTNAYISFIYVLTTDGSVYVMGNGNSNNYGQFGVGTTTSVTEFTQVSFNEPVVQIGRTGYMTFYLTESGNLYVSGGSSLKAHVPQLVARNVTWLDSSGEYFVSNGYFCLFEYYDTVALTTPVSLAGYEILDVNTSQSYHYGVLAAKDGQAHYLILNVREETNTYTVYNDLPAFPGVENVVGGSTNGTYGICYAWTADGQLYGGSHPLYSGTNAYYGMSIDEKASIDAPVLIPVVRSAEELTLLSTNLDGQSILHGESLVLTFNKELRNISATLTENGTAIALSTEIDGNVARFTCPIGLAENVNYVLTVSAAGTQGLASIAPTEDIPVSFTYLASSVEEDTEASTQERHESILDESIQRYWTTETFRTEIRECQTAHQVNPYFYGNAILNRISTDTEVTHWLRPIAPTVSSGSYSEIPLGGNYWGTTNETAIALQMVDYTDFVTYARLMYQPYLTEAPENTFPFVTSVKLYNKSGEQVTTVGNEEVTFRVTFNRDMDTSIPLLVRFGSAYPYGDYVISGEYVDARTWEGKYTLNTLIENGNQYFTISNGCSATDDLELQPDTARFGFVIDTTAAQALIMQGEATDTGIQLHWTQDDFDTLMGYNVYRATKEDGLYTRLNSTVIPADTMEFFDATVEPGVKYYYNFTVVKTDLTESDPSGKISIMSKDTMAPDIYHSPVVNAFTGSNLVISATVTDNLSIAYANLYYRVTGTDSWKLIRMNALNDKYSAIIPSSDVTAAGVEYYIEAFDGVSYTYKGGANSPYGILVQEAVDVNSLGDVNGDGKISNLDALMLLQAINDLLNLDAEQFARADLNGDGELMANEALRILQYVNGSIGSLVMS